LNSILWKNAGRVLCSGKQQLNLVTEHWTINTKVIFEYPDFRFGLLVSASLDQISY